MPAANQLPAGWLLWWPTWVVAACLLASAGCGGKLPPTRYYILSFNVPRPAPSASTAGPLTIKDFSQSAMLRRNQIMYRPGPNEVAYYTYHCWATDPAAAVSKYIFDDLLARRMFAPVRSYDGTRQPGYLLEGVLERLEEVDSPQEVTAHAELSATLSDGETGDLLWQGSFSGSSKVEGTEVSAVVTAMTAAVESSAGKLLDSLQQAVKTLPPPAGDPPRNQPTRP